MVGESILKLKMTKISKSLAPKSTKNILLKVKIAQINMKANWLNIKKIKE